MYTFGILSLSLVAFMAFSADATVISEKSSFYFIDGTGKSVHKYLDRSKYCGRRLLNAIITKCGPGALENEVDDYTKMMGTKCCLFKCSLFDIMSSSCPAVDDAEFQRLVSEEQKVVV